MAAKTLQSLADAAADHYGIPRWIYRNLIRQESGWNPDAHNPSGATGLVQIHLPSHPDVTDAQARNPAFALDWGARYLAAQHQQFGDWTKALAAYNAGPGNVASGKWMGFPETRNYVKAILGNKKPSAAAAAPVRVPGKPTAPTPTPQQPDTVLADVVASNNQLLGLNTPSYVTDLLSTLAAPVPSPAVPSGTGAPGQQGLPTGNLGGLAELFYDPKGGYDSGQFIKPIGGHTDHLHASVTNPQSMLWLINEAQKQGYRVRENPYVDPVQPVHTDGSFHYKTFKGKYNGKPLGEAVDISGGDLGKLWDIVLGRFGVKR